MPSVNPDPEGMPGTNLDPRLLQKVTVRLLPFMLLLYIVSYLDRINISFAGLQMNRDLGFDAQVFGFGSGIFFIGYFLFGIPSNLMVERVGARSWISAIMVVWGIISMSMALVSSPIAFCIMRFLLGVAEAGFFPGMILYLTYWFPRREHGKAVARFMTAIPLAGVMGGCLSWLVYNMNGVLGLPGWKWLFVVTGAPAVVLGAAAWFYLVDRPQQAKWLSQEERTQLEAALAAEQGAGNGGCQPKAKSPSTLMEALTSGRVWVLAALYLTLTTAMYGFQMWLPQIVQGLAKANDSTIALLCIIPALFQALGMLVVATSSDRSRERRKHVAGSALIAALGFIATAHSSHPALALAALCATAFGIWGTVGPFWALPTSYLNANAAAAGIALINSVGNLGGFVGPCVIGTIKVYGGDFHYALYAMAFSLVVAAALSCCTAGKTHPES